MIYIINLLLPITVYMTQSRSLNPDSFHWLSLEYAAWIFTILNQVSQSKM